MYIWNSKALERYAKGFIIVCAENVNLAREKVRLEFDAQLKEIESIYFDENGNVDENWKEEYTDKIKLFESDIAKTPKQQETIFILGSE